MSKLDWFLRAKYGAIIHWGLYAIPGGLWQGEAAPHGGEWIMKNWRQGIPFAEYKKLAGQFNPTVFDADEYVRFLSAGTNSCPYYRQGDEYTLARKQ